MLQKTFFKFHSCKKLIPCGEWIEVCPISSKEVQDGEKSSFKIVLHGKSIFLSVTSRHLIFKEKNLKLIALTDVSSELAAKEAEAWQKLLRVLTHEISNSAIPLSTLSSYIYEMVIKSEAEKRKLTTRSVPTYWIASARLISVVNH